MCLICTLQLHCNLPIPRFLPNWQQCVDIFSEHSHAAQLSSVTHSNALHAADGDEDDKTGALIEKKPRTMDGMQEGMDAGMMMLENTDTGGGGGWSHLKNADGMPLRGRGGGVHEQPDAGSEYDD